METPTEKTPLLRQVALPLVSVLITSLLLAARDGRVETRIPPEDVLYFSTQYNYVRILDVRDPEEYAGRMGHLPGAIQIPVQDLEERIAELEQFRDKVIIIYDSTGHRAATATEILRGHGFTARMMDGGIAEWTLRGYPVIFEKDHDGKALRAHLSGLPASSAPGHMAVQGGQAKPVPSGRPPALPSREKPMKTPLQADAGPQAIQDLYPDELSHCYGCGRLNEQGYHLKTYWDGNTTVAKFRPDPYQTALPGFVYGGLIASLIDCHATGTAAAAAYRAGDRALGTDAPYRFVTASLKVDYLHPTPMGEVLELRGTIEETGKRKVIVGVTLSAAGEVCARGTVVAVRMPESMVASVP